MARSEHVNQKALAAEKNWQLSHMGFMPRLLSLNVMPCHGWSVSCHHENDGV